MAPTTTNTTHGTLKTRAASAHEAALETSQRAASAAARATTAATLRSTAARIERWAEDAVEVRDALLSVGANPEFLGVDLILTGNDAHTRVDIYWCSHQEGIAVRRTLTENSTEGAWEDFYSLGCADGRWHRVCDGPAHGDEFLTALGAAIAAVDELADPDAIAETILNQGDDVAVLLENVAERCTVLRAEADELEPAVGA